MTTLVDVRQVVMDYYSNMTPLYTINFYQNQFKTFLAIVFMGQNDIHANVAKNMVVVRNLLWSCEMWYMFVSPYS